MIFPPQQLMLPPVGVQGDECSRIPLPAVKGSGLIFQIEVTPPRLQ